LQRHSHRPARLPASISFARDVQPIFNQICVKCHGGEEVKEGLSLKTYAEIMQGSDNGAVIAPGDPANSLLVDMIQKGKMPKRGPRLLPKQIQAIVDWVTAGAQDN
jgi:mono/diheme cytochrome c family protein